MSLPCTPTLSTDSMHIIPPPGCLIVKPIRPELRDEETASDMERATIVGFSTVTPRWDLLVTDREVAYLKGAAVAFDQNLSIVREEQITAVIVPNIAALARRG